MEIQGWSSWVYTMRTLLSHRCTSSHTRYSKIDFQSIIPIFLSLIHYWQQLCSVTWHVWPSHRTFLKCSVNHSHEHFVTFHCIVLYWFCVVFVGWAGDFARWQQSAHVDIKSPQWTVWAARDWTVYAHRTSWVKQISQHWFIGLIKFLFFKQKKKKLSIFPSVLRLVWHESQQCWPTPLGSCCCWVQRGDMSS